LLLLLLPLRLRWCSCKLQPAACARRNSLFETTLYYS
jgi:hypothetical protein